jgi:hypothetical protein
MACTLPSPRFLADSPKSGITSVVAMVWVCAAKHPSITTVGGEYMYAMDVRMQFERFYSLNHSVVAWLHTYIISADSPKFGLTSMMVMV